MKKKTFKLISLIVALVAAVALTVGYVFAWFFDKMDADFNINGHSAGAYFDSGDGSKERPFVIANPTHMHNLAVLQNTGRFATNGVQKQYYFEIKKTIDEIDMSSVYIPPIGNDEYPFIGIFNGNGKTLSNLKVTTNKLLLGENYPIESSADYAFSRAVGLFGMTGAVSDISNVILENPLVDVANTNTKYFSADAGAIKAAQQVAGIAVGFVAGKCSSIGVRALDEGATLHMKVNGYSTFNSILGALGDNVTSSVTGGGAGSEGTGGSGNAFGASFDVESLSKRLFDIYLGKYGKTYKSGANERALENLLPLIDTKSDIPVPALGYKVPFTVDSAKSIYSGATAQEIAANNNVGYVMGNQNKISTKTLRFASSEPSINSMIRGNDGTYTMPDGSAPTNNNVPRWFYTQNDGWENSNYQERVGFGPISQEKYNELPDNIKSLLVTESNQRTYTVMRIQAQFNEYGTVPINSNALDALTWGYHGQISWMGKTYGEGIADNDGNAVNSTGYNFTSDGYLLDDKDYMFELNNGQKFYVVQDENWNGEAHSVEYGEDNAVAITDDGIYFGRYRASSDDAYIYGYLDENGYFYNEDGFVVAEAIDGVVASITAEGYAIAPDGKYYGKYTDWSTGSGVTYLCDLSEYGYVLDDDGYLIPSSSGVNVKSDKTDSEGHIVNENGELYRYYQYGWPNGVVVEDSDGYFKSEDGTYYADFSNSWPISSYKVDSEGYYILSNGERYTDYNGNPLRAYGYYKWQANDGSYYLADEYGNEVTFTDQYNNTKILTLASSANVAGGVYLTAMKGDYITAKKGENIYVKSGSAVPLYAYKSGVALPNNGIWFKPSQAGKMRFVMFAQKDSESFSLLKCTRTNATVANPFYTTGDDDITVQKVIQQRLPVYALFYYEFEVKAEEVYNTEYVIVIDNNVGGNGAYFLYLDIGSSATEEVIDTSTIDREKAVSAIDFIYDGVEIKQGNPADDAADALIKVGDFIVRTSGDEALYEASKTSVYFEDISTIFKLVFLRLYSGSDGHADKTKTICLEQSDPVPNTSSEVKATFATYVCPTISGGSGTVGGGGGGTVTPTPGPDDPVAVASVSISGAPATMTVGGTATLTAIVTPNNATDKTVTWTASNGNATVDGTGKVTAVSAGSVTITATAGGKSDSVEITVTGGSSTTYESWSIDFNATKPSGSNISLKDGDVLVENALTVQTSNNSNRNTGGYLRGNTNGVLELKVEADALFTYTCANKNKDRSLVIKDANGEVVHSQAMDEGSHTVSLSAGTYTITFVGGECRIGSFELTYN